MAEEQKVQAETNETAAVEETLEAATEAAQEQTADTADATALEQALAAKDEEIQALKDQALRAAAEAQNARRRAEQDIEKAHKFALEKFTNELLPVVDSLERALEAAGDDEATQSLREGVEMTLTMFTNGLAKFNVEQVNPVGETFNPELHQAMSMVDGGDAPSNSVIAVVQKGYTLHGRLVRPAMVMVAK